MHLCSLNVIPDCKNSGKYLFSGLVEFLPKRIFDGIVKKYSGDIKLSNVAYANANRDYRIFEEFAYYMICLAQSKRLDRELVLHGKFYAFDSTTIDLCLSLFKWAFFRKVKGGIKVKTLFDVVNQILTCIHIMEPKDHDVNAMDDIESFSPNPI